VLFAYGGFPTTAAALAFGHLVPDQIYLAAAMVVKLIAGGNLPNPGCR
jgi:hypothetical protein